MSDDLERAKEVICLIVAAAGGRLEGKLRLFKAFYFAHLFYWKKGNGVLTQHPVVRMPFGPGIHDAAMVLKTLVAEGKIRISSRPVGPYSEQVYELAAPVQIDPTNPRYQAIEEAVEGVRNKSAAELSQETHIYSRSWREAREGDVLDIYRDLLEDDEYAQVRQEVAEAEATVNAVF